MRVALVGAASGIGAMVAKGLKARGAEVIAFDVAEPPLADRWIALDLNDPASIKTAAAAADGPFDALLNNAGLPPREGMEETILTVNYLGLMAFQDLMLDKLAKGAAIVTTASRAGAGWRENLDEVKALLALGREELGRFIADRQIDPTRAYNLSKEALIVTTMARTEEMLARGVRINSVSPAAVSTGILGDFKAAFGDKVERNIARVGRAGRPEEVAEVILFLASPESHWIKGQDIVIDGGMTALMHSEGLGLNAT